MSRQRRPAGRKDTPRPKRRPDATTADTGPLDAPPAADSPAAEGDATASGPAARRTLLALVATVALWKAAALGLLLTLFWDSAWASHLVQDIRTWRPFFEQARAGLVPYVHFTKEYPVLGGALYWVMGAFVQPDNLRQTVLVHGIFMGLADLFSVAVFHRLAREAAPRFAIAATLAFGLNPTSLVVSSVRFESFVVLFALLGLVAHRRKLLRRSTFLWSLGCGLKWYPAFFIAAQEWRIFAREGKRWHWLGAALVFLGATAVVNVPFLLGALAATGSTHNWTYPYLFHAQRPLYWDTVLGVGQIWLGPLPWEQYAGIWTLALMVAVVLVRPGMGVETKGVLICLATVIFNRIYSCQFNLWFYPLLILTALRRPARERNTLAAMLVLLDLLNVIVFPFSFAPAVAEMGGFWPFAAREQGGPWTIIFSLAILVRALVIAVLAAYLLTRRDPDALDSAVPENA